MKASQNPFRTDAVAKLRYRIDTDSLDELALNATSLNAPACILGPEGTGKTTLLEDIHRKVTTMEQNTAWIRLNRDSGIRERKAAVDKLLHPSTGMLYFMDGGEVLSALDWWRIRRSGRTGLKLIATLHNSRGLDILHRTAPDWPLTKELVTSLHQDARLEEVARSAYRDSRGNVREVFRACYWTCARNEA